ncbi:MAG: hypothetical protein ACO3KD_07880 [Gaiellales bacterium]|jgi:hypothetical protein
MPMTPAGRRGIAVTALGIAVYVAFVAANDALAGLGSPWRVIALLASQIVLLTGGGLCLVAITRRGERSLAVYAALLPSTLMVLAIIAEVTGLIE